MIHHKFFVSRFTRRILILILSEIHKGNKSTRLILGWVILSGKKRANLSNSWLLRRIKSSSSVRSKGSKLDHLFRKIKNDAVLSFVRLYALRLPPWFGVDPNDLLTH